MPSSNYLIVGSSHAGLSALEAIRLVDREGSVTLVSQEERLPYSPTILPYVVSGMVNADRVFLRSEKDLDRLGMNFLRGETVTAVEPSSRLVTLASGKTLEYEKLLLATGASPSLPGIEGLPETGHHVLRTLDSALALRDDVRLDGSAVVLGGGLIGMHGAENLRKGGMKVSVVEALPQVLPGYFDNQAAGMIQQVFAEEGITVLTGKTVERVARSNGHTDVYLDSGDRLTADVILVSTGVQPRIGLLSGSDVKTDRGILVDEYLRTSVSGIWAAGDAAQAPGFFDSARVVNATLPDAVEQGRIAGMDMASDPALKPYVGGMARNTYKFFGHRAFSVGLNRVSESGRGIEESKVVLPTSLGYQRLLFQDNRLVGASGINSGLDPGIMYELIRRKLDLEEMKKRLADAPVDTSRLIMSKIWR